MEDAEKIERLQLQSENNVHLDLVVQPFSDRSEAMIDAMVDLAAWGRTADVERLLLERQDPNLFDSVGVFTPLGVACLSGHADIAACCWRPVLIRTRSLMVITCPFVWHLAMAMQGLCDCC